MATVILKNSSVAAKIPLTGDLSLGELAVNTTDGIIYMKNGAGSVVEVANYNLLTKSDVQTTDATVTTLQTIAIPTNDERIIIAKVRGNQSATGDSVWKVMRLGTKNVSGTVTLIGSIASDTGADAGGSTWVMTAVVSGTNIIIQVTGEAAHTIDWNVTSEVN